MKKVIVQVPISVGELLDKITILELKKALIQDSTKQANIVREYNALINIKHSLELPDEVASLEEKLRACNKQIWDIENAKRACESVGVFEHHFIELSRALYINNDQRSKIKKEINDLVNSEIVEEKMYTQYSEIM